MTPALEPHTIQHVGSLAKSRRETIECTLRQFSRDHVAVDFRTHCRRDGERLATGRGIVIPVKSLRDAIDLLRAAERAAVARGLLPDGGANG